MVLVVNPSSVPEIDEPPRRRLWIPLSLRRFGAILMLLGVASVLWVGVPAYRQLVAIQEIERCGGDIGGLLDITTERGPTWLREFVGKDLMTALDGIDDVYFRADSTTVDRRMKKLHYAAISMATLVRDGPSIDDSMLSCIT